MRRVTPTQSLLLAVAAASFPLPAADELTREAAKREAELRRVAGDLAVALSVPVEDALGRLRAAMESDPEGWRGWHDLLARAHRGLRPGRVIILGARKAKSGKTAFVHQLASGLEMMALTPAAAREATRRLEAQLVEPPRRRGCAPHPAKLQRLARRRNRKRR